MVVDGHRAFSGYHLCCIGRDKDFRSAIGVVGVTRRQGNGRVPQSFRVHAARELQRAPRCSCWVQRFCAIPGTVPDNLNGLTTKPTMTKLSDHLPTYCALSSKTPSQLQHQTDSFTARTTKSPGVAGQHASSSLPRQHRRVRPTPSPTATPNAISGHHNPSRPPRPRRHHHTPPLPHRLVRMLPPPAHSLQGRTA